MSHQSFCDSDLITSGWHMSLNNYSCDYNVIPKLFSLIGLTTFCRSQKLVQICYISGNNEGSH